MREDAPRAEKWKWVNEVIRELREPINWHHSLMHNDLCITMNKKSLEIMADTIGSKPSDMCDPTLYGIPIRINNNLPIGQVILIQEEPIFKYSPTKEERYVFDEE